MSVLFYDTETTGVPEKYLPIEDERQPHIVQIAGFLSADDGKEMSCLNLMTRPAGWVIPDAAAAVHGITTETALKFGMSEKWAVIALISMGLQADMICGHNVAFDDEMLEIAVKRFGIPDDVWLKFKGKPRYCTADHSTDLVNIPPTQRMIETGYGNKPKRPKLIEAYKHFFGEEFDGAHDAMVDVRACARVFFHLQQIGA